ncbi:MAG: hypothetical protein KDA93_12480 [Planctomycetaceae bacterium]|nr:hypothetical protein [Planctomycetaceae bacterium]
MKEVTVEREARILKERDPYVRSQRGDVVYSTARRTRDASSPPESPMDLIRNPAFVIAALVAVIAMAIALAN